MQTDFPNIDDSRSTGLKQDLVKKSFMLGASNYIVKPLNRDKVIERLSYVLNS